ncbi:MAG: stress-responsive transcription factor hsf1 [Alyxoria varia]|nr:MAG: stress-responsive transcription factor hsf1 [Alyxoria varia]
MMPQAHSFPKRQKAWHFSRKGQTSKLKQYLQQQRIVTHHYFEAVNLVTQFIALTVQTNERIRDSQPTTRILDKLSVTEHSLHVPTAQRLLVDRCLSNTPTPLSLETTLILFSGPISAEAFNTLMIDSPGTSATMENQPGKRKRPHPSSANLAQNSPQQNTYSNPNQFPAGPHLPNEELLGDLNTEGSQFQDVSDLYPLNSSTQGTTTQQPDSAQMQQPNQLVRRNQNDQLTTRAHNQSLEGGNNAWPEDRVEDVDDELSRKAAAAKREATSRRPFKNIPPFIQKLRTFVDHPKNNDLIRWSPRGDSFIVVDEDQFAKRLIPELFKHDKYASFVRQLNMYGFHKRVGLSDNSMRQSENRSKNPSEYENPYFIRGRPDLMWLINKPKTNKKSSRDDAESEEEEQPEEFPKEGGMTGPNRNLDLVTLPRSQLQSFQKEIEQLKRSQQQINGMIARFQLENSQYVRQASQQHEQHEKSINAILTFLATFYNRGLDPGSYGGAAIPNAQQPQGNVVEEYDESTTNPENQLTHQPRRPLAILPPPTTSPGAASSAHTPEPAGSRPTSSTQQQNRLHPGGQTQPMRSSALRQNVGQSNESSNHSSPGPNSTDSPASFATQGSSPGKASFSGQSRRRQSQQQYSSQQDQAPTPSNTETMAAINNVNANASNSDKTPSYDFSAALENLENANNGPLTAEQRANMLSIMANQSGTDTSTNNNALMTLGQGSGSNDQFDVPPNTGDIGNLDPSTANITNAFNPQALDTNTSAMFPLDTSNFNDLLSNDPLADQTFVNNSNNGLDNLQRLQQEQSENLSNLAGRLQPLSPSGSIPGFHPESSDSGAVGDGMFGNAGAGNPDADFDLNSYIDGGYFDLPPGSSNAGIGLDLLNGSDDGGNAAVNPDGNAGSNSLDFNFGDDTQGVGNGFDFFGDQQGDGLAADVGDGTQDQQGENEEEEERDPKRQRVQ